MQGLTHCLEKSSMVCHILSIDYAHEMYQGFLQKLHLGGLLDLDMHLSPYIICHGFRAVLPQEALFTYTYTN